jgi:hypothetical protein
MALLKDKNETLQRQNNDLSERVAALESRDGSLFDLRSDSAVNIAAVIKAETIAKELLAGVKRKPRPAG